MANIGNLASREQWGAVKSAVLNGADIEGRVDAKHSSSGMCYTALLYAAYYNHTEMFSWLIQRGADANALDTNQKSALHIAAKYGSAEVVRQLLLEGVDPNHKDKLGRLPVELTKDRREVKLRGSKKTLTKADLLKVDQTFAMWPKIKEACDAKGRDGLIKLRAAGGELATEAGEYMKLASLTPKQVGSAVKSPPSELDKQKEQFSTTGAPAVFVSYCWAEKELVRFMADQLQKDGHSVWLDVGQMGGGDELFDQIDTGLRGCKVVVACVSPRYARSLNCRREVSLASDLGKPIIPILADPSAASEWPPKGPMGFLLTGKLYIDLSRDYSGNYGQLLDSLAKYL